MNSLFHTLTIFAHVLIGFYFVFFGFWNIYHWAPILAVMARKRIPHPYLVLALGILVQFLAGGMIMFGIYASFAALILIPSILIALIIFHPFWEHKGDLRRLNFIIFVGGYTITFGALLLLIATSSMLGSLTS